MKLTVDAFEDMPSAQLDRAHPRISAQYQEVGAEAVSIGYAMRSEPVGSKDGRSSAV